jgi:hypothetical protein
LADDALKAFEMNKKNGGAQRHHHSNCYTLSTTMDYYGL